MQEKATIFKVLGENMCSWNQFGSPALNSEAKRKGTVLQYEINKWTRPKISKSLLFAFDSFNDLLESFPDEEYGTYFWEAEGLKVRPFESVPDDSEYWKSGKIRQTVGRMAFVDGHLVGAFYPGGVGCTAIKIKAKISPIYKILREDMGSTNPNRKSEKSDFLIYYKEKDWTAPKIPNSKLFGFSSLEAAKEFIGPRRDDRVVYRGWGVNVEPVKALPSGSQREMEDYWRHNILHREFCFDKSNMVWADKIFLSHLVF